MALLIRCLLDVRLRTGETDLLPPLSRADAANPGNARPTGSPASEQSNAPSFTSSRREPVNALH
jgi:hypothetical protein